MAKVVDLNINPDIEDLMLASVKTKNRYYSNSIIDRKIAVGGRQYESLKGLSHMKKVSAMWHGLTQAKRDEWASVAENCNLTGWQLFLQDISFRLRADLPGFPLLSEFHQYKVYIFDNSDWYPEFSLTQNTFDRPYFHKKNVGQKNARTWVDTYDEYAPTAKLEFSFFSDMEMTPEWDTYNVNIELFGKKGTEWVDKSFHFDLPLVSDWFRFSEELIVDWDFIYGYLLEIYGLGVKGIFMLDNLNVEIGGVNLGRDPFCNDVRGVRLWAENEFGQGSVPAWSGEGPADGLIDGSYYLT